MCGEEEEAAGIAGGGERRLCGLEARVDGGRSIRGAAELLERAVGWSAWGVGVTDGPCATGGAELPRGGGGIHAWGRVEREVGAVVAARECDDVHDDAGSVSGVAEALQRAGGSGSRDAGRGADGSGGGA